MEVNKRGIAAVIREVVTKQTLELYEDLEKRRTTPDKLRCLNLDSMWKRDKNKSDTQKAEEELVLWNSFNCHELLRDMTGGATDQTMQRKCLNMKSITRCSQDTPGGTCRNRCRCSGHPTAATATRRWMRARAGAMKTSFPSP